MKKAAVLIMAAALAFAQPATKTQTAGNPAVAVYLTAKGTTYHTWKDCMGLKRSRTVLTASEADAQQHGLVLCGICAHRHHVQTGGGNATWAKEVK